ncbi:leucyl aminopeptidase [Chitinimonas sp. BJB300]|uniref:leucyl aminopeptidase n=1 Tax=Chitinimonas sp. BJB300 TaxID=1559339 RepID=UPI000C0FF6BD|nr:leucyl aminopeptidase [Chitinimonas sp. BJB300]PHV13499.1 leucyl aminopeptidase [Chitinimonas sp. BJB300]TSJ89817.1 leucyl aminopeptidase [Chitinimonas sp. BJB300]
MEIIAKAVSAEKQKAAVLALSVQNGKLGATAAAVDKAAGGHLAAILKLGDLDAKAGSSVLLHKVPGVTAERVLLVSVGEGNKDFRDAARAAVKTAVSIGGELAIALDGSDMAWTAEEIAIAAFDASYKFDTTKSKKSEKPGLKKVTVLTSKADEATAMSAVAAGAALGEAISLAKDLGNLPPNFCTPTHLANTAKTIAKQFGMKVEVLDRPEIEKLGMLSFVSVAKGSVEPMKLIVLKHEGGAKGDKPVVLVGKGITFDSGGISLKPGANMDEMKYDMMGAGSVLATMHGIGAAKLPLNVYAVVATCENMPAGNASKPGDVVTTMKGLTVEILNTDAEGRLVLCDALTYTERFDPAVVIDVATLTGACVVALGNHTSGLYANKDALARELQAAGDVAGDRAWQMPMGEEYHEQLKSNFADLANIGGPGGGSVTAACFLSRFAEKYDWAHLDIAGTAWKQGAAKGATGRPVPLLTEFLRNRAALRATAKAVPAKSVVKAEAKPATKPAAKSVAKTAEKPAAKSTKTAAKSTVKAATSKPAAKTTAKPVAKKK